MLLKRMKVWKDDHPVIAEAKLRINKANDALCRKYERDEKRKREVEAKDVLLILEAEEADALKDESEVRTIESVVINPRFRAKLETFAKEYLVDFNITKAASRIGASSRSAAQLGQRYFWNPYTQIFLTRLLKDIRDDAVISRKDLLVGLLVEANNSGRDANSATRIAAWREIGRLLGMYVDKKEVSFKNVQPTINLIANKPDVIKEDTK